MTNRHEDPWGRLFLTRRLPALGLAMVLLMSCSGGDCSQAVLPSFAVTVVDATTDESLAAIATGTIVRGTFSAPFTRSGDRLLAGENRSGTYTVTLTAPGYVSWQDEVFVESDGCIIHTKELRVELEPEAE